jgi:hypothetical protein
MLDAPAWIDTAGCLTICYNHKPMAWIEMFYSNKQTLVPPV